MMMMMMISQTVQELTYRADKHTHCEGRNKEYWSWS